MEYPDYYFSCDTFDLKAAYDDIKQVFDSIHDDQSYQKADSGILFYRANEILFALSKCTGEPVRSKANRNFETEVSRNMDSIKDFLGEKRIDALKDYVLESLKENLDESIHNNYVAAPDSFDELMEEMIDECGKEIKKKYKKHVSKAMGEKVEWFIENLKKEDC